MASTIVKLSTTIPESMVGKRLDQALASLMPEHSRARLKRWILSGECQVDGLAMKPKCKVLGGEYVEIEADTLDVSHWEPEFIPLNIVYEDRDLLVINKQANLVVHPAAGNYTGTLVNGLLQYIPELRQLPRAGVVHRLDKDTTGLMVVAKSLIAHTSLIEQLQARQVSRIYEAIVSGVLLSGGTIDKPIGRHARDRIKMAVVEHGKPAITHYRILKKFAKNTHIQVQLETGRTHQIRVHMAYLRHAIFGDRLYGGRIQMPNNQCFPRQALHAQTLAVVHPKTQEKMCWEAPLPCDMVELLGVLSQHSVV